MTVEATILQELKKLREDVASMRQELFKKNNKVQWVSAIDIMDLTGWNKHELQRHRENETVQFKRQVGSRTIKYNINSIPDQFIKHMQSKGNATA